ncbi:phosphoadenylyl-sulfate reductase [Pelagibius litoralis]|uniref:Adenosine 5'-phosphosulfate reductase n=2 Tax=Pelagibius litoralis TaxID=374515 RepID=A0A967KDA1_9PROT|nr:phosphoadenylyl-sulfate reductase [Pelagibius litoralis]
MIRPAANQDLDLRLRERARLLELRYGGCDSRGILSAAINEIFDGRIAVVSSFGAESAVLLDLVAQVDPATPVVFLETGKHFPETLAYRDQLVAHLGLSAVRSISPTADDLAWADADGTLWRRNPDLCCRLRKVLPLERGLSGFSAWINGRKRFQGGLRGSIPVFEASQGRIKVNPLAAWDPQRIQQVFRQRGLPAHPLAAEGYLSIGCAPCTFKGNGQAGSRSGRWQGREKTECGIHQGPRAQRSRAP